MFSSLRNLWKIESCQFHATRPEKQKNKKGGTWFSKKKEDPNKPKIIKPGNCAELSKPILDPQCKNALIVGGADGFGFAAADHLLCKGAQGVAIVDLDVNQGRAAVQKLCNCYGKGRVQFFECDAQNPCQYEAVLKQALCKYKSIHILFNDLDRDVCVVKCNTPKKKVENFTAKAIQAGIKIIGKNHAGSGGIIVNCASIYGFLGWPQEPFPIYCKKEPAIEVTNDFAEEYNEEETGVRLVTLCPTNKLFNEIGLPDLPDPIPNHQTNDMPACIPNEKRQIGPALSYVLSWAKNGSTWLVEPAISVHEIPRLIHFPEKDDEKIDPKIYETETCTVKMEPPCADTSKACQQVPDKNCEAKVSKKK